MSVDHRGAWSDFWAQNSQPGQGGGCLPERWQGIDTAQSAAWADFARMVPNSGKVLDLATGDGRVMRWLQSARRDLKLTGVDISDKLPEPPRGTKVRNNVRMEDLPFPDGRFDAVVSQFGFEYGNLGEAAAEMSRVLSGKGRAALMTHRKDGPILAHNLARREQILWAIEERDLPAIAKQSLSMRHVGNASVPTALAQAPAEGAKAYGPQSAAWEIAEAIRQSLVLGQRDSRANVAGLIETIVGKARNELERIASLEAACEQASDDAAFASALSQAGLVERNRRALRERMDRPPFADFRLIGRA